MVETFVAFTEDLDLVPNIHMVAYNQLCNSSSKGFDALFWCLWALHTHDTHVYMQAKHR